VGAYLPELANNNDFRRGPPTVPRRGFQFLEVPGGRSVQRQKLERGFCFRTDVLSQYVILVSGKLLLAGIRADGKASANLATTSAQLIWMPLPQPPEVYRYYEPEGRLVEVRESKRID
jgi:hypothetical protein